MDENKIINETDVEQNENKESTGKVLLKAGLGALAMNVSSKCVENVIDYNTDELADRKVQRQNKIGGSLIGMAVGAVVYDAVGNIIDAIADIVKKVKETKE